MGDQQERGALVDLQQVAHQCRARWRNGAPLSHHETIIRVGVLTDDDRWFVDKRGGAAAGCRSYTNRETAWATVNSLMALHPGPWTRIPCHSRWPTASRSCI